MTHRILVVEDDQDIGDLSQESLTRAGYEVLRAKDGAVRWSLWMMNWTWSFWIS